MLITEAMRLVGFGHTAPFPRPSPDAPAPEFRRFGTFDDFNEERNLEQLGEGVGKREGLAPVWAGLSGAMPPFLGFLGRNRRPHASRAVAVPCIPVSPFLGRVMAGMERRTN